MAAALRADLSESPIATSWRDPSGVFLQTLARVTPTLVIVALCE